MKGKPTVDLSLVFFFLTVREKEKAPMFFPFGSTALTPVKLYTVFADNGSIIVAPKSTGQQVRRGMPALMVSGVEI